MKKIYLWSLILCCFGLQNGWAQEPSITEAQIIEALNSGAKYASNVILDEDNKSRCDYNLTEGKWYEYEIPWHTGQIIYGLLEANRITGEQAYLDKAVQAGDWWISMEIKDHPKLKGMLRAQHGDHAGDAIVFATVSDGSASIYMLSDKTGDRKYAEVATRAGKWMLDNMYIEEEGLCYDNVDPRTGEVMKTTSPFWPGKENMDLFDVSRPNNEGSLFLDMYRFTNKKEYKKAFINLCESLVKHQGPEGLWMEFMPNFDEEGSYHPRFNLWYAESLIDGYELTGDKRYLDAAVRCARVYAKAQDKYGSIYYKNYINGRERNRNSVCGSAVSFSGILWIRLIGHGVGDEFKENIEKSAYWVYKNRFADDHPDENLRGAFLNSRLRHRKNKLWLVNRDVGTSFGLRFMAKYHDYRYQN